MTDAHRPSRVPSPTEVDAARTPAGGWSRDQLAAWGVPWPPPKGWRAALAARHEKATATFGADDDTPLP